MKEKKKKVNGLNISCQWGKNYPVIQPNLSVKP